MERYTITLAVFESAGFGMSQIIFSNERDFLDEIRSIADLYDQNGILYVLTIDRYAGEATFRGR